MKLTSARARELVGIVCLFCTHPLAAGEIVDKHPSGLVHRACLSAVRDQIAFDVKYRVPDRFSIGVAMGSLHNLLDRAAAEYAALEDEIPALAARSGRLYAPDRVTKPPYKRLAADLTGRQMKLALEIDAILVLLEAMADIEAAFPRYRRALADRRRLHDRAQRRKQARAANTDQESNPQSEKQDTE